MAISCLQCIGVLGILKASIHIMSSMHWCARNFESVNSVCVFPGDAKLQEFEDEHPELLESPWKDPPFFHLQNWIRANAMGPFQSRNCLMLTLYAMRPRIHFPQCMAKGSCFSQESWGWRCVRSRLLFHPKPSTTVRNLSQLLQPIATVPNKGSMAMPVAIAARAVTGRGLERHATSFCVAGMALRDIPMSLTPACCV